MADNAEDLVVRLRQELDDTESGAYLWSDDELYRYVDRAQRQFARLTNIFLDGSPSYAQISLIADTNTYALPEGVLSVEHAYLTPSGQPLAMRNYDEMLAEVGVGYEWRTVTGAPRYIVRDNALDTLTIVPVPDAAYTLQLITTRLPLKTVSADYTTLELRDDRHIDALLLWAKHLAYDKHDVDTNDTELSTYYETKFRTICEEYRQEIVRKRRRPSNVAYGGY